jgi:hypothetical protein
LGKQRAEFGGLVDLFAGQGRGDDRAGLRIDAQVQLPPRPAALASMLFNQPFAWPAELQPFAWPAELQPGACMRRSTSSIFSIAFFLFQ